MIRAIIFDCYGVVGLEAGSRLELNQECIPVIQQLGAKYRIAMLSNSSREFLEDFLVKNAIRPLFDTVLASGQTRFVKPQREIFDILAQRLDLPFSDLVFIDDSAMNIAAAQSYGIISILYRSVAQLETDLKRLGL
jgi:HAD superfamily hydrolase (TIGR01509 family)